MAGIGEACSHVAGLLFTLEAQTLLLDARHPVPTSLHVHGTPYFQDMSYEPITNINFSVSNPMNTVRQV